ncbi:MAG: antibiotic biosynthesis monooxygenase [Methanobacterium sp.]
MHYMLIIHKVEDYDKWRTVFDENETSRRNNGSKGAHVFRNADNPNEIVILFEWDNVDNARKFFESSKLSKRIQNAGIIAEPEIHFMEGIGRTSA